VAAELRHLVEKQHAVMGEADLAGPRNGAATDECHVADRVMRRAKGPRRQQSGARKDQPGHRMHGGDFHRLVEREGRKDAGQAAGHHGFSGAGRAHEQRVVTSRRGDLQCAAGQQLTVDVGEIGRWGVLFLRAVLCRELSMEPAGIVERVDRIRQAADAVQLEPMNRRGLALVLEREQ